MKPEEIKKEWPREVSERIFELARQRLPTNEIRQIIREQYPAISWDDRRFYNRLSEERQKMKQRDTASRAIRLANLGAQLCTINAGSEDLSHYVENKLMALLEDTCRFINTDINTLEMPYPLPGQSPDDNKMPITPTSVHSFSATEEERGRRKASVEIKRETERLQIASSSRSLIDSEENEVRTSKERKRRFYLNLFVYYSTYVYTETKEANLLDRSIRRDSFFFLFYIIISRLSGQRSHLKFYPKDIWQ
jgi:hypothetical protein